MSQMMIPLSDCLPPLGSERITYYSGPNEEGKRHYALEWVDDYFPGHPEGENVTRWRGQHFYGVPPKRLDGVEPGTILPAPKPPEGDQGNG